MYDRAGLSCSCGRGVCDDVQAVLDERSAGLCAACRGRVGRARHRFGRFFRTCVQFASTWSCKWHLRFAPPWLEAGGTIIGEMRPHNFFVRVKAAVSAILPWFLMAVLLHVAVMLGGYLWVRPGSPRSSRPVLSVSLVADDNPYSRSGGRTVPVRPARSGSGRD